MNTYEDAPNPFSSDPSPPATPKDLAARSPAGSPSRSSTPLPQDQETPFAGAGGSKTSSVISAASGSPPPAFRATFPSPGSKSYVGPKVKEGNCCDRDAELQAGVEISVSFPVSRCAVSERRLSHWVPCAADC
jgi:sorting nexin-4